MPSWGGFIAGVVSLREERSDAFSRGAASGKNGNPGLVHFQGAHRQSAAPKFGPLAVFTGFWGHRRLILRLARREIEAGYRGSFLGLLWLVLRPLLLLAVFTFVFSVVFQARWQVPVGGKGHFALLLFAGLIVFNIFAECVNRAPGLILENPTYVKKVVFPLEVLPWVSLIGALFNALMSLGVLLVIYVFLLGIPPWTAVLIPVVVFPLVLLIMGLSWFLASVGVFIRDLRQIIGVITMMFLFLSPIFYPITALPEGLRQFIFLSPLTLILEETRAVLFWGALPDWRLWVAYTLIAWLVAWLGLAWFAKTRKGFADVV